MLTLKYYYKIFERIFCIAMILVAFACLSRESDAAKLILNLGAPIVLAVGACGLAIEIIAKMRIGDVLRYRYENNTKLGLNDYRQRALESWIYGKISTARCLHILGENAAENVKVGIVPALVFAATIFSFGLFEMGKEEYGHWIPTALALFGGFTLLCGVVEFLSELCSRLRRGKESSYQRGARYDSKNSDAKIKT